MNTVGVRELKNRLTSYLRRTQEGESLLVTDRGRAVAILGPVPAAAERDTLEERLARMAARGAISLPAARPSPRLARVRVHGASVSEAVIEDRR